MSFLSKSQTLTHIIQHFTKYSLTLWGERWDGLSCCGLALGQHDPEAPPTRLCNVSPHTHCYGTRFMSAYLGQCDEQSHLTCCLQTAARTNAGWHTREKGKHVMHTNAHHPLGYRSTLHALSDASSTWPRRQNRPGTDLAADTRCRWPERWAPPVLLFPTWELPRPGPNPPGTTHPMGRAAFVFTPFKWPMGELFRHVSIPPPPPVSRPNWLWPEWAPSGGLVLSTFHNPAPTGSYGWLSRMDLLIMKQVKKYIWI